MSRVSFFKKNNRKRGCYKLLFIYFRIVLSKKFSIEISFLGGRAESMLEEYVFPRLKLTRLGVIRRAGWSIR